ncbi:MAG: response regulator transcription factor [Ignavibacteria bacterium]|nr:response regulator transcription factor [Ignavibacteria bacterium]
MSKIQLILADDHTILRDGLKNLILTEPGYDIIAEAEDGLQAIELTTKYRPSLLILDLNMPRKNGIEVIKHLRGAGIPVKILVLSMFDDQKSIIDAYTAGANGYLNKMASMDEFFQALQTILAGNQYVNEMASNALLNTLRKAPGGPEGKAVLKGVILTSRETEILGLIADGLTSQEIAEKLFISYFTVSKHRKNILKKLKLKNTAELVNYAIRHGIRPD